MEKEKAFNFKISVPPRINTGLVSVVKHQEIAEEISGFIQPKRLFSKCLDKDLSVPSPKTNMVAPSKSDKTDAAKKIAVLPMEKEQKTATYSEVCSKLFEETEKIKCWKFKMELEITQKDKLLQDNRKTIENQRKAIQELQYGNESLSMKLENQMREHAELKNKCNATQNFCNIVKDAFEKSAEKMNLYESERLETHHLFMQNSDTIQRMITVFEGLRVQAENNRTEMLKLKEGLQQHKDVKERFEKELSMKQEEITMLSAKIDDKDKKLQEILQNVEESEQCFIQMKETARQHYEMLQCSKQEQEQLYEMIQKAEKSKKENEKKIQTLEAALECKDMEYAKVLIEKNSALSTLNKIKFEQEEKLLEIQTTAQQFQDSLKSEMQRTQELEVALSSVAEELKIKRGELGETVKHNEEKDKEIEMLREDMKAKTKSLELLEEKLVTEKTKASQLDIDLKSKHEEICLLQNNLCAVYTEKELLQETLNNVQKVLKDLEEIAKNRETELHMMGVKLDLALSNELESAKEIDNLKKNIDQHEKNYKELMVNLTKLQVQNEQQEQYVASEAEGLQMHLQESKEKEKKIRKEIERLEEENSQMRDELESLRLRAIEQDQKANEMQGKYEGNNQSLQKEVMKKEKQLKALEIKLNTSKTKIENKTRAHEECLKENKSLKKQLAAENEKCNELIVQVNEMKAEFKNIQRLNDENLKTLQAEIKMKIATEAELQKKVEKLSLQATEASKSKEETEVKCQQKISDMVALMEKHKNQYDKMVEDKDTELENWRVKEAEVNAVNNSLVLELSEMKIDNSHLKQQLEHEIRNKDKLNEEITTLKIMKSVQEDMQHKTPEPHAKTNTRLASKKTPSSFKSVRRSVFSFAKETEKDTVVKTSSQCSVKKLVTAPLIKETKRDNLQNSPSWKSFRKAMTTPKIKSYRICTPPSAGQSVTWSKSILELEPKSDSSEQTDFLNFHVEHEPMRCIWKTAGHSEKHLSKEQNQTPTVSKSPGEALKLAAVKRMRDAGWTAVTSADMKKKKASEKIFA